MIIKALLNIRPGAKWSLIDDGYAGINWPEQEQSKPSEQEVAAEVARLIAQAEADKYKQLRAAEYPPIADYLDGVVKGDQAQIDAYIAACQAVKAKYPKP